MKASIKVNSSGGTVGGCCRIGPHGLLTATNVTLRQLIQSAYQRHPFDSREISGGPPWIDTARFDLEAWAATDHALDPDGHAGPTWSMLRSLLADRFTLRIHTENSERPLYALVLSHADGKLGPRLRKSDVDCAVVTSATIKGARPTPPMCAAASYPGRLVVSSLPMPTFACLISKSVDRIVVDRTQLSGRFDVELEAVEIRPPGPFGPSYGPSDTTQSIFAALPEQLGLELKPTEGPVEILIVDGAEKPAEG